MKKEETGIEIKKEKTVQIKDYKIHKKILTTLTEIKK